MCIRDRLYVDPKNENRIYNLYSSISKSEDGGRTFTPIGGNGNFGGVHPDHHAFYINPHNTEFLMLGNDGGAYLLSLIHIYTFCKFVESNQAKRARLFWRRNRFRIYGNGWKMV